MAIVSIVAMALALTFPTAALADTTTFLRAGDQLNSCNTLTSPNGRYILELGCDGNLKLIEDQQRELWASNTSGIGAATLEMQRDGNLTLYAEGHIAKWETSTSGNTDAALGLQDDGNLVVIAAGNHQFGQRTPTKSRQAHQRRKLGRQPR